MFMFLCSPFLDLCLVTNGISGEWSSSSGKETERQADWLHVLGQKMFESWVSSCQSVAGHAYTSMYAAILPAPD